MKTSLGLLLLATAVMSTNPGIRVACTNQTLSNAFNLYAGQSLSMLLRNYGDFSKKFSYLDVDVQITLQNTTLTSITYDPALTKIELQEPDFIIFNLKNVSLLVDANYTLKMLTTSSGWIKLNETDSDLLLNVSITNTASGKPSLLLNGAQLTIGSMVISSDMDFVSFTQALRDALQREIDDHLADFEAEVPQLLASLLPKVNALVSSISLQFDIPGQMMLDMSLVDTVQVADNFLSVPLNGTVYSHSTARTSAVPEPIPLYGSMPEPIQVQVSDYTINTAIVAKWWSLSFFLQELPPQFPIQLNTDELALFIPQLRNHFGVNRPLALSFVPNKDAGLPSYSTNGNVTMSFCVDMEILCNPTDQGWQSGLTLTAAVQVEFTGWVTDNVASATVWTLSLESLDVTSSAVGPIDIGSLVIFVRKAISNFIPQLNAFLSEMKVPISQILFFTVLKDDVVVEDGYLGAGVEVGLTVS